MTVAAETEAEKLREAEKPSLSLQIGTCLHQRGVKVSDRGSRIHMHMNAHVAYA